MVRMSLTNSDASGEAARSENAVWIECFFHAAMKIEVRKRQCWNVEKGFPFSRAKEKERIEFQFSTQGADAVAKVCYLLQGRLVVFARQQREVHNGRAANQYRCRHPGGICKAVQCAQQVRQLRRQCDKPEHDGLLCGRTHGRWSFPENLQDRKKL